MDNKISCSTKGIIHFFKWPSGGKCEYIYRNTNIDIPLVEHKILLSIVLLLVKSWESWICCFLKGLSSLCLCWTKVRKHWPCLTQEETWLRAFRNWHGTTKHCLTIYYISVLSDLLTSTCQNSVLFFSRITDVLVVWWLTRFLWPKIFLKLILQLVFMNPK